MPSHATTDSPYPYRPNVQMWVFNAEGKLLFNDESTSSETYWKFPQGGVDAGETHEEAVKRELREEVNITDYTLIAKAPFTYRYEWDERLQHERKLRGQEQTFYLIRANNPSQLRVGEPNIRSSQWMTFEQILQKMSIPNQIKITKKVWKEFGEAINKSQTGVGKIRIVIPQKINNPRTAVKFLAAELSKHAEVITFDPDLEKLSLTKNDLVLFSLASPLEYEDLFSFLTKINIPLDREKRHQQPTIIGGGIGFMNPEPLAQLFDIIVIGPSLQPIVELINLIIKNKESEVIELGISIPNLYIPSKITFRIDSEIGELFPTYQFTQKDYPIQFPISSIGSKGQPTLMPDVGCKFDCSFCQLTNFYPYNEAKLSDIRVEIERLAKNGNTVLKIASADTLQHSKINEIIKIVKDNNLKTAFGSARFSSAKNETLAELVQVHSPRNNSYLYRVPPKNGKGSLTFGAESATNRILKIINKGITVELMKERITQAASAGISNIGLYFLVGLPTETEDDIESIADLIIFAYKAVKSEEGNIYVGVNPLIPSPNTPMQRVGMLSIKQYEEKINHIKLKLFKELANETIQNKISFQTMDIGTYLFEMATMRGDRRTFRLFESFYQEKIRFDEITEEKMQFYLKKNNLPTLEEYQKPIPLETELPWKIIISDSLIDKEKKFFERVEKSNEKD